MHYCLGRVTDVNVSWLDTHWACDTDESNMVSSCCEEKAFFIQLDDEHQPTSMAEAPFMSLAVAHPSHFVDLEGAASQSNLNQWPRIKGPPPLRQRFKWNCSFIFYG